VKKTVYLLISLLFLLVIASPLCASEDPHGYGFAPTEFKEAGKGFEIKARYPEATGVTGTPSLKKFNGIVKRAVDDEVKNFKKEFQENQEYLKERKMPCDLHLDYTMAHNNEVAISVIFSGGFFVGGAHPSPIFHSIFYDIKKEKECTFRDLFTQGSPYLKKVSETCTRDLKKTLGAQFTEEGAAAKEAHFNVFYITKEGLTLIFPPYQVACYAAGPQQVIIPFEELKGLLLPQYVVK
jgi:hypothetical protein